MEDKEHMKKLRKLVQLNTKISTERIQTKIQSR